MQRTIVPPSLAHRRSNLLRGRSVPDDGPQHQWSSLGSLRLALAPRDADGSSPDGHPCEPRHSARLHATERTSGVPSHSRRCYHSRLAAVMGLRPTEGCSTTLARNAGEEGPQEATCAPALSAAQSRTETHEPQQSAADAAGGPSSPVGAQERRPKSKSFQRMVANNLPPPSTPRRRPEARGEAAGVVQPGTPLPGLRRRDSRSLSPVSPDDRFLFSPSWQPKGNAKRQSCPVVGAC